MGKGSHTAARAGSSSLLLLTMSMCVKKGRGMEGRRIGGGMGEGEERLFCKEMLREMLGRQKGGREERADAMPCHAMLEVCKARGKEVREEGRSLPIGVSLTHAHAHK